ncbi:MAG TPA: low temperature requirement protein A [bacterium]
MTKNQFWHIPQLRTDEDQAKHRKVTWLELFYDLFVVVVISKLANELVGDITVQDMVAYVLLFVPIWWIWIGSTYYNERFETEGLENRLMFLMLMFPLVGLAVFVHDALGQNSAGFALSYVVGRLIITLLWLRASIHVKAFRPVGKIFVLGFSISIVMFLISIFVSAEVRYAIVGIALVTDMATPWFTLKEQAKLPRFSTSKLPERFGLLLIIVLGESVAGVVKGLSETADLSAMKILIALIGVILGFTLWWIYFDFIARRVAKPTIVASILWSYLHLPLAGGIAAIGASLTNLIQNQNHVLPGFVQLVAFESFAVTLISMGFLELTLRRDPKEPTHPKMSPILKIGTGFLSAFFSLFLKPINSITVLAILIVLNLIHVGYGFWVWVNRE